MGPAFERRRPTQPRLVPTELRLRRDSVRPQFENAARLSLRSFTLTSNSIPDNNPRCQRSRNRRWPLVKNAADRRLAFTPTQQNRSLSHFGAHRAECRCQQLSSLQIFLCPIETRAMSWASMEYAVSIMLSLQTWIAENFRQSLTNQRHRDCFRNPEFFLHKLLEGSHHPQIGVVVIGSTTRNSAIDLLSLPHLPLKSRIIAKQRPRMERAIIQYGQPFTLFYPSQVVLPRISLNLPAIPLHGIKAIPRSSRSFVLDQVVSFFANTSLGDERVGPKPDIESLLVISIPELVPLMWRHVVLISVRFMLKAMDLHNRFGRPIMTQHDFHETFRLRNSFCVPSGLWRFILVRHLTYPCMDWP